MGSVKINDQGEILSSRLALLCADSFLETSLPQRRTLLPAFPPAAFSLLPPFYTVLLLLHSRVHHRTLLPLKLVRFLLLLSFSFQSHRFYEEEELS